MWNRWEYVSLIKKKKRSETKFIERHKRKNHAYKLKEIYSIIILIKLN